MSQHLTGTWLPFYLRDHMAAARSGVNLFGRVARGHSHPRVRAVVRRVGGEVEQDCQTLRTIMKGLGVRRVSVTMVAGVVGERVGRLKPNGALATRSGGADVLELEALTAAVQGKARLWDTLLVLSENEPRLDTAQLRNLQERATGQRETLIDLHTQVVRNQLTG